MRSYRDLPLRYAEFGTVYRWEQSGEVGGLTRVRGFTQDDAHLFLAPEQLREEFKANVDLILLVLNRLQLSYTARVGLRDPQKPDKYVGSAEAWKESQEALLQTVQELGLEHTVEEGEAAIYGPKLDFIVRDAIGREWQLGTVQVDYVLPERFGLEYTGRRWQSASTGNDSSRAVWQPGALHRCVDRAFRWCFSAMAGACAGDGSADCRSP
jgi:threonyl-tRNA synthetase